MQQQLAAGDDNAASAESVQCRRILTKITWRLLPFMLLLYIVSYLDRINVSFAGLQMNQELGFNESVFGFGAGIFFIGYFMFGIPSNLMVQKIGARRWISTIMVIWGIVSVGMAFVKTAMVFYIMRFILGVAEAGFFPGMILYLTYWFPQREHGLAVARFMTAIPIAGVLGGLISWKVLAMNGVLGLPGWKLLFLITGSPAIFLGIIVFYYLPDGPLTAAWLCPEERQILMAKLQEHKALDPHAVSPTAAFRDSRVWLFALIYFSFTLGMYGFQLWLPQIIHGFGGLTDSATALLSAVPALFQALGMIIIAQNSDRTGERRWHVFGAATLASLGLVCSAYVHDPVLSLIALSVAAFGTWGMVGPFWALPTACLPAASSAAGIALINSVGNLGGFVGPSLVGLIKSHTSNFTYALLAMAFSLFLGAVLSVTACKPPVNVSPDK